MTCKLIAMDLDGTLLNEELEISPRVYRVLRKAEARGVRLTLASGRAYPPMRRWAVQLGIATPLICYQGAVVADPLTHETVYRRTFPRSLVGELACFARERDLSLTLYVDDQIYLENKQHSDAFYDKWFGLPYHLVHDLPAALPDEPAKFIIVGDEARLDAVRPEVEGAFGDRLQIVRSHRYFLEGLAQEASKGHALAWVAGRLGISAAETMAIGDSGNDASMIAWAGVGVAMGNASPEAKAVADYIVPSVDEDGVAVAVERFCLGNGA